MPFNIDFAPGNFLIILGGVAILVLIFLIFRELVTWYWKINETIDVLKGINKNLHHIAMAISDSKEVKEESPEVAADSMNKKE